MSGFIQIMPQCLLKATLVTIEIHDHTNNFLSVCKIEEVGIALRFFRNSFSGAFKVGKPRLSTTAVVYSRHVTWKPVF